MGSLHIAIFYRNQYLYKFWNQNELPPESKDSYILSIRSKSSSKKFEKSSVGATIHT